MRMFVTNERRLIWPDLECRQIIYHGIATHSRAPNDLTGLLKNSSPRQNAGGNAYATSTNQAVASQVAEAFGPVILCFQHPVRQVNAWTELRPLVCAVGLDTRQDADWSKPTSFQRICENTYRHIRRRCVRYRRCRLRATAQIPNPV
jgi:hypothetical protein